MLGWGTLDPPSLAQFTEIRYVPLTDCAVYDEQFQHHVADIIAKAYFDPSVCVMMRLPSGQLDLPARMRSALAGIRGASWPIPQTRAANIFFASGDLGDDVLLQLAPRLGWWIHHSFDHWRHAARVYQTSRDITVFLDPQLTRLSDAGRKLLTEAFGQAPRLVLSARSLDVDGFPETP
jgi:hypothetical protein